VTARSLAAWAALAVILSVALINSIPAKSGEDVGTSCEDCAGYPAVPRTSPPPRHRLSRELQRGPPEVNRRWPDFVGRWEEVQGGDFRVRIVRNGRELEMTGAMNQTLTIVGPRIASTTVLEGCAPENQHRGYYLSDPDQAGRSSITLTQTGQTLRYEHRANWFVPCADIPKGIETKVYILRRSE
jgi:hypothetical protein